jgi:anti-sigma factor RsiW
MLSNRHCELLTAYVDGELDAPQRQVVRQLLASSAEACAFLHKLELDSGEMLKMAARRAPATLAPAVMRKVSELGPLRGEHWSAVPRWQGFAVAACVFVAIGLGGVFLIAMVMNQKPQNPQEISKAKGVQANEVHLAFAQFQEEPAKQRLADESKKRQGLWFDVPAINAGRAIERMTEAFQTTGITVLVDLSAKTKIARKEQKVQFVLYAENVTHEEVAQIFQHVARAESSAASKALDSMVMTDINEEKRTKLATAMQVDAKLLDSASSKLDLPMFIEVPNNQAIKQPAAPKRPERFAVLLTYSGEGNAAASAEVRQFLNSRRGLQPGTVQMVLLIHEQAS